MLGLHLGTRMTVVALRDGGLWLHSPVEMTPSLRSEVDALGPVRHIVCPNLFHQSYAAPWAAAYRDAIVHGPKDLDKRRPELRGFRVLSSTPPPDWKDDFIPVPIEGSILRETVFVHPSTRTLISSDLVENYDTSDHLPTRLFMQVGGVHGKVGWNRLLRIVYYNRSAARASVERLLEQDFDRVIVAHGNVIETGGKEAVRAGLAWL
jgi:hypothetical protein